ncbi:MAG: acyl-CoA dehydratase activase-related protein [Bacillota bacterium]|nr:acyl-CoA dehydratase activase-related protein [Bacillota bacterium]
MRIGIPRALLSHSYLPLWATFWQKLGHEVLLSGCTTKTTLDRGVKLAVDEACLPIKIAYGHLGELKAADAIFLPRLIRVEKRAYLCPKFMGLPDMLRAAPSDWPPLIDVKVDLRRESLWQVARAVGKFCDAGLIAIWRALAAGLYEQRRSEALLQSRGLTPPEFLTPLPSGQSSVLPPWRRLRLQLAARADLTPRPRRLRLGVLGHPYNLYDPLANFGLFRILQELEVEVQTPEMLPAPLLERWAARLPKPLFWTFGKRMVGAAYYWLSSRQVDGLIHLLSFGCGPDSLVGELIQREASRRRRVPFLLLTVDEHTGEAGFRTRLEAFIDMLRQQKARAGKGRPPWEPA